MVFLFRLSFFFFVAGVLQAGVVSSQRVELARSFLGTGANAKTAGATRWELAHATKSAASGVDHVYFMGSWEGQPVFNVVASVHLDKSGGVAQLHASDALAKASRPVSAKSGALSPVAAFRVLCKNKGWNVAEVSEVEEEGSMSLVAPEVATTSVSCDKGLWLARDGSLKSVHQFHFKGVDDGHWRCYYVDLFSGEVLDEEQWSFSCAHQVWDLPLTDPLDGSRELVVDPPETNASPFGWHSDGVSNFTVTQGNNALAREDRDANDTGGYQPDGGAGLVFDFPFEPGAPPLWNEDAAIAQIFYVVNWLHDVHYQYGFDEASGNFQANNRGLGGVGNDEILVDVQDGAALNNAVFSSPPDGNHGWMEAYIWRGSPGEVQVTSPFVASYPAEGAVFGNGFGNTNLVAEVVQAWDSVASFSDACQAVTNSLALAGNVALIDRGDCFFTEKVLAAQVAGAIAVIIVNNAGDQLVNMAGEDPSITIPTLFIGQSDGQEIKNALATGTVVASMSDNPDLDAGLDNVITIHEYGHGVSTRLTGGAGNSSCLQQIQSGGMGEGWSDWWGLVFTSTSNDTRQLARGIGVYANEGAGIRRYPYSTDMSINPLTFGDLPSSLGSVHRAGEIWCLALWEMYWNLVERYGFDSDWYFGSGGNNKALQLVIEGLKLQPCNPTFLDARDAILAADTVLYGAVNHDLIWQAFAKRGMGNLADDGGTHTSTSVTEDFTMPTGLPPEISSIGFSNQWVNLEWMSVSGEVFDVQSRSKLDSGDWALETGAITATAEVSEVSLHFPDATNHYFRVRWLKQ